MIPLLALACLLGPGPDELRHLPLDAEVEVLAAPAAAEKGSGSAFSLGVHAGWFKMRDAEDGELYYGAHARLGLLKYFAAEASVDIAKADFIDDDAEFRVIPIQVTGMFFPLPEFPISPYVLTGAGWYHTSVEYSGTLAALDDERDRVFGIHFGAGVEVNLLGSLGAYLDVRYVFLDEPDVDNSKLKDEDYDTWQVSLGASLRF